MPTDCDELFAAGCWAGSGRVRYTANAASAISAEPMAMLPTTGRWRHRSSGDGGSPPSHTPRPEYLPVETTSGSEYAVGALGA
jgi:hypothetical protein